MVLQELRACDVCRLLDFDTKAKLCSYCALCDAWLCIDCGGWSPQQLLRRAQAASKRLIEPGFRGSCEYVESLEKAAQKVGRTKGA